MKNRILLLLLAVMLVLSMGIIGCGGEEVPEITEYNLTTSSTEGGSVTNPGEGTFTYDDGVIVNLTAEAEEGYHFVNWTGDVATVADVSSASTTITMNNQCSITADFAYGPAVPLKNPDSFVQMTLGDVESFDPAWVYDSASAEQVGYIYETLVYFDGTRTDEFVPVLATEWELLDDNFTYRFKIREGVKFHEGGNLTAEDVEYSFERAMVQDRHADYDYLEGYSWGPVWVFYQSLLGLAGSRDADSNIQVTFDQIDNAIEVDDDWVVFHLVDSAWGLPFLQILSQPVWSSPASIVDKEWCIANGEWDGTEETWEDYNNPDIDQSYLYNHTNGTGPWRLEEWDPGVQIKLVRNDDYWRQPAPFKTVITKLTQDWTTREEALLAGDADLVYVPQANIDELEAIADLAVYHNLPQLSVNAFFFNLSIAADSEYIGSGALDGDGIPTDFFTDMDVRRGFNYAFDWETYVSDALIGEVEQRGSPILEGLPFYNPDASMYSLDLEKAAEHLKAAWVGDVWEKGFKFTIPYNPANLQREIACKILAENLLAINPKFQVSTQSIEGAIYWNSMWYARDMPMFQIGWVADYPHPDNLVVPFMASYGTFAQLQSYGYPELDQLINDALKELDLNAQQDMYYEIQERYYEDAPSIMLCQPLGRRYFTKYVHGFYYNPMIPGQPGPLYYMSKSSS